VTALHEKPRTGERERTSDSTFVFVAVDEDGEPTAVPDLQVESERDERLREQALDRPADD
jgi:acyl-CoA hydrolase